MLVASPVNSDIHDLLKLCGWELVGHRQGWRKYWRFAAEGDLYIELEAYRYMGEHRV